MRTLIVLFIIVCAYKSSAQQSNPVVEKLYNSAAELYVKNDNMGALKQIREGQKIEPENRKLKELAKKILEKQKNEKDKKKDEKGGGKKEMKNESQPQPQQSKMSKEEAQRMLDALKNNEKRIAGKRKIKGDKNQKSDPDKDW